MTSPFKFVPDGPAPATADPVTVESWPAPSAPLEVAYCLGKERTIDDVVTVQHWRGDWWEYRSPCWVRITDTTVRGWIYNRLRSATFLSAGGEDGPVDKAWNPDRTKVGNVIDALGAAVAALDDTTEPGTWLPTGETIPGVVATPAGLFQVATRQTTPTTPRMFSTWALPFDYDHHAAAPSAWLSFLDELWPNDPDTISMLQEWMGYLVSGRTDMQKAMLLVGPRRSGKGTILRVAQALVGKANTAGPTLQDLTSQFGLQKSIGKALIAVGDARLASGAPTATLVERLLSIIGEDTIQVDVKFGAPWTGRMHGRVMIASNEVPDFRDASGAIGSRFLVAKMVTSFYDREDTTLEGKLMAELPGILKWALDGLDRLGANRRFTQSAASVEAREDMEEAESPVSQFTDAACVTGSHSVPREVLYAVWLDWAERNGYGRSNISTFGRQLRSAHPTVGRSQPTIDGRRVSCFTGIGLRESYTGNGSAFGKDSVIKDAGARDDAVTHRVQGC
jgi:putative DNA primase/helicase